jgi:hypothetical protein
VTRSFARRVSAGMAAGAALVALRAASFAPLPDARRELAWARLSWSARPERIEHCRRLSDAELAARPAHMRLRLECEGRMAQYILHLTVDGSTRLVDTVRGGGLRRDRPMHVLRDIALEPGARTLAVRLARLERSVDGDEDAWRAANDSIPRANQAPEPNERATPQAGTSQGALAGAGRDTGFGERDRREREERLRRAGEAIAPLLTLDTLVTLHPGRVLLITYDGVARRLVARAGGS